MSDRSAVIPLVSPHRRGLPGRRAPGPAQAMLLALLLAPAPVVAQSADSLAAPPPRVRAWQVGLLRPDRLEHASLGLTLGLGAGILTREPAAAAGCALGLGLAKEVRDRRHGGFDALDLAADALGGLLAAVLTRSLGR